MHDVVQLELKKKQIAGKDKDRKYSQRKSKDNSL